MDETLPLLKAKNTASSAPDSSCSGSGEANSKDNNKNYKNEELSTSLRVITNTLSLLSVFFFSGIIFGWAPLELMLLREGIYASLANNATDATTTFDEQPPADDQQMQRLNAIFTVAQFLLSFASLPIGFFVDHAPKPLYFACTAGFQVVGLLLFAYDSFLLGYALIAVGGSMTMLGSFPASFLLPNQQAGILAAISCLFDASSVVFFVFHRLGLQYPAFCSRRNLFLAWSGMALVVYTALAASWTVLEQKDWKKILEQEAAAESKDTSTTESTPANDRGPSQPAHNHRLRLHQEPVARQLCTFEFALVVIFASVHMLRCNYYIMTVDSFLWKLGDTDSTFANLFSIILPCGIVYVPLIERAFDKLGVVQTLYLTNALGVVFGTLLVVSNSLFVQAVDFGVFTAFRAFLYASMNTMIAVYFGVHTMGRIIGFTFTLAAVVSLLQYPAALYADQSSSGRFGKQGGNFFLVNVLMLSLCALPIVSLLWYDLRARAVGDSGSDDDDDAYFATPGPSLNSPMLLTSPGSGLRNSLRHVQDMRRNEQSA